MKSIPVFDGHNDVLLRLWLKNNGHGAADFLTGDGKGHIDLPRMRTGGFAGGFFAIFSPSTATRFDDIEDLNPPPENALVREHAAKTTEAMMMLLEDIVAKSSGEVSLCRSVADIRTAIDSGSIAVIMHIEGAEAIGADLDGLETYYQRGLRSIGPVWSRSNQFGHGVPFRFPSSPDTGSGLTKAGIGLVKKCNQLRVLVDLSHLNEKGFWDVARISTAPLVATHSNVHALSASSRNLTDKQLKAIGESQGMVGLNFATGFLRDDGHWNSGTAADVMLRHLDHMMRLAGEDCVGLGSDFDGARIPSFIGDAAGLQNLLSAMQTHGYGDKLIRKLAFENWLRVLQLTWGG